MFGTDVAYGAICLRACYAMPDTDLAYGATGMPQRAPNSMNNYGVLLNEIGYQPTRPLRDVRY
eukprot:3717702-Rhodomonas_salina.1